MSDTYWLLLLSAHAQLAEVDHVTPQSWLNNPTGKLTHQNHSHPHCPPHPAQEAQLCIKHVMTSSEQSIQCLTSRSDYTRSLSVTGRG